MTLRSSGIGPCFEKIFISEAIGYNKPAKEYFDRCYNILAYLAVLADEFNDTELASSVRDRFNALLE